MKKAFGVLALASITFASAQAAETTSSLLLRKVIGDPKTDNVWSHCELTTKGVSVTHKVNGTKIVETRQFRVNDKSVLAYIQAADKDKLNHIARAEETAPHVTYAAAAEPEIKEFVLSFNGHDAQARDGSEAKRLVKFIEEWCGKWTVSTDKE